MPRSSTSRPSRLARIIAVLREEYGRIAPPPAPTAFALVLWEKVAYLASDAKRAAAFATLVERVGLTPEAILAATPATLEAICALGGPVEIVSRARGMHDAAALVMDGFGGSLEDALAQPLRDAKRELQRFHGIGEPGAEKILLLRRAHPVLALDSNGLRTMVRLGYGANDRNYARMYRGVAEASRPEQSGDLDWLIDAHVLLRHHGQARCKTSAPRCPGCPLRGECAFGAISPSQHQR